MIRKEIGCEATRHDPGCPCQRCAPRNCGNCNTPTTIQHEIPRSIGREILKLSPEEINKYTIMVSRQCHRLEDERVKLVLSIMRHLKRKEKITPTTAEVLEIRRMGLFRRQ